jgi:chemotaxis signal transduction protein
LQGVFAWGKRNIPVVRIHHELGLALPPRDTPLEAWLLVVRTQSEALGILVNNFVGVQWFESSLLQPAHTPLGASLVPGTDGGRGHPIQLISSAALFKALPMSAIGAETGLKTQANGASAAGVAKVPGEKPAQQTDVSPEAHVIFRAGRTMATPLKALLEIVMSDQPGEGTASSPPTHYSWRGKLVPMIDLRLVMEGVGCAAGSDGRVLIVKVSDRLTAVLVESVIDIVPAFVGTIVTLQMNHSRSINVLTTDVGGKSGSYEIVDVSCQVHHP